MVVGSLSPWAETIALYHNAKYVYTVEYASIKSEVPEIIVRHPYEIAADWKT